jgi:hypothetical protein
MTDSKSSKSESRRRWVTFGEIIGLAALLISGLGLWLSWQSSHDDKPTRVVEQKLAIPLILRGAAERDGRQLVITPVEPSHALESLTVTLAGRTTDVGSDGRLSAGDLEPALKDKKAGGDSVRKASVRIAARYVEAGTERRAIGTYVLSYRWEGGGLFGGRSLRLVELSR